MQLGTSYNVILIVTDAMRADHLSVYGYPENTTPNLVRLGQRGAVFNNAFCCSVSTDPSLTSIMTGFHPNRTGIHNHGNRVTAEEMQRAHDLTYLSEVLRDRGYSTIAVDFIDRWHKKGYHKYVADITASKAFRLRNKLASFVYGVSPPRKTFNADAITDIACGEIAAQTDRFFLFLHYWDTHAPYSAPPGYVRKFHRGRPRLPIRDDSVLDSACDEDWKHFLQKWLKGVNGLEYAVASYDAAIAHIDSNIGRIVNALEENGLIDTTLLVITSDHGESLTEHGIFFDHHGLYDPTIRVPLLFVPPENAGLPVNVKLDDLVQHVDIFPTILDLLDDAPLDFHCDGFSLLPFLFHEGSTRPCIFVEEAYTERKVAVRTDRYKYIRAVTPEDAVCRYCGTVHGGEEELYDLHADPLEVTNVVDRDLDAANRMVAYLAEFTPDPGSCVEVRQAGAPGYSSDEEVEVTKRLRDLGYF
jgi:arylsulfatase A-like enzyme